MDVSIIIVSYNTCSLLRNCVRSVLGKTYDLQYEIFVIDNASSDDSCAMVEQEFPEVNLIRNSQNFGFAKANNQAIRLARGEYVLLLNSDTVLENNAIGIMHEFMQAHPRAAVCGPLLLNADGTVQRSIGRHHSVGALLLRNLLGPYRGRFPRLEADKYHPKRHDYSKLGRIVDGWVTGAALMIRRTVFADTGLLDENYYFSMEDADWGLAVANAGWDSWFVPQARVTHLLGSSGKSLSQDLQIEMGMKIRKQEMYYVLKNLGMVQYWLFRVSIACILVVNLLRRVFQEAIASPSNKGHVSFKRRLGWKHLLASICNGDGPKNLP
jgi:GT2 family glycosyltransferase